MSRESEDGREGLQGAQRYACTQICLRYPGGKREEETISNRNLELRPEQQKTEKVEIEGRKILPGLRRLRNKKIR